MYSSTLSLTSALDGGGWSTSRPGRFIPGGGPSTQWAQQFYYLTTDPRLQLLVWILNVQNLTCPTIVQFIMHIS